MLSSGDSPASCTARFIPDGTPEVEALRFLQFVRDNYPAYYERLCACASGILGVLEIPAEATVDAQGWSKLPPEFVNTVLSAAGKYKRNGFKVAEGESKVDDSTSMLFSRCDNDTKDTGTAFDDVDNGGNGGVGGEGGVVTPMHEHITSAFQELSRSEAALVRPHKPSIAEQLKNFYTGGSIFSDLGRVPAGDATNTETKRLKTLHNTTEKFLDALAPPVSPTIDDVSPFELSSIRLETTYKDPVNVFSLKVRPVPGSKEEQEQNSPVSPIVFILPPDEETENRPEFMEAMGLRPIYLSAINFLTSDGRFPPQNYTSVRTADSLEAYGSPVNTSPSEPVPRYEPVKYYIWEGNAATPRTLKAYFERHPTMTTDKKTKLNAEFKEVRSTLVKNLYYLLSNDRGETRFHKCISVSVDTDDRLIKRVDQYNNVWKQYHHSQAQWKRMEDHESNDKPIWQVMEDILLLDLSRFGWAPCWSTPEDKPFRPEDFNAGSFLNDIAEFSDNKKKIKGVSTQTIKDVFKQTAPQWKCTHYMHTIEFAKSRRVRVLCDAMDIESEDGLVESINEFKRKELENKNTPDKKLDNMLEWLKGRWHERADDDNLALKNFRDSFAETMAKYHKDDSNDAHALCICFTATFLRVRGAMQASFAGDTPLHGLVRCVLKDVWYDKHFQFANVFRRFRLLAFKTVSVPAHETLKNPAGEWVKDQNVVCDFLKYRMNAASLQMAKISEQRQDLSNDFITHAREVRKRATGEESSSDIIVKNGLTLGMASKAFDNTCICMRTRLRFASTEDRDNAFTELVRSDAMAVEDAEALIDEFEASKLDLVKEGAFNKSEAVKKRISRFVKSFSNIPSKKGSKDERAQFEMIAKAIGRTPNRSDTLNANFQGGFLCEALASGVLYTAMQRSRLQSNLRLEIKSASNKYPKRTQGGNPLCFKEPGNDTEILLLFMLNVDEMVVRVPANGTTAFVADNEIDKVLAAIRQECPHHRRPNESVQNRFSLSLNAKVDVWRMDWWVGKDIPVNDYETAQTIAPIIPYQFSDSQLRLNSPSDDADLRAVLSGTGNLPPTDPFQGSKTVSESMRRISSALPMIDPETASRIDKSSIQSTLFQSSAEATLEIYKMESIARICRIAFGLLEQGPLQGGKQAVYEGLYEIATFEGDKETTDFLVGRVVINSGFEQQRAVLDPHGLNGASILPPFQMQRPYTKVEEKVTLALPVFAIGIFRCLQQRISSSSRYLKMIRQTAFQRSGNTTKSAQQFETEAQAAWNYSHSTVQQNPLTYEFYKPEALTLATYLYPNEFVMGRRIDNHQNMDGGDKVEPLLVASNPDAYRRVSELYMACSTSNLKAVVLQTTPPVPTEANLTYARFKRIATDMANIAEGVRMAFPLFQHMYAAAELLKRKNVTSYRFLPGIMLSSLKHIKALSQEVQHNHATFEDSVRSYADMASTGVKGISDLQDRFVDAYRSVRKFRRTYDAGFNGIIVYMTAKFNGKSSNEKLKALLGRLFTSLELIMKSESFVRKASTLASMFSDNSKIAKWMTNFGTYSVLSSRVHMNAVLGCATAAAPFRNLPEQHNDVRYMRRIRNAISFDTFGGFFSVNGELANFYCFLPASQDVLEANESLSISVNDEVCHQDQVIVTSSDDMLLNIGVGDFQIEINQGATDEEQLEREIRDMLGGDEERRDERGRRIRDDGEAVSDEEEEGDDDEGERDYGSRWKG